jgi:4-aminobutyrate aminotransferase
MISEKELAQLSYEGAPKVVTGTVPGPKTQEYLERSIGAESMARGGGKFPFVFSEGKGSTVKDPDGNLMIDITAGVAVNAVGRCHPRVIDAMQSQMGSLMHASDISNVRRTELAEKISSIMAPGLRDNCITYFTQDGSGAVETAIKFVRKITGRSQIVAFHGAYHGVWLGANSMTTGDQYRQGYGPYIPGVIHLPYPYSYRCCFGTRNPDDCAEISAKYVDYVLNTPYTGADDVGAVFIESQQGEGGYIPAPPGFLEAVKKACEKHGALYISDEVQSGAGRTGKMWCIEHYGVQPDMLIWGKGMGGDVPMAGLSIRKDLAEKIDDHSQPNTFAGNAVASAACMANIDILTENDNALINRASELGQEIKEKISAAAEEIRVIGDVRGKGLMIGIEMVEDKETREPLNRDDVGKIIAGMLNRGMLMVPCGRYGNVFRFMPPLVLTREHASKAVDILLDASKDVS